MQCPLCGGKAVGKVGLAQYYCWDCFIEYQYQGQEARLYVVEEDGNLLEI